MIKYVSIDDIANNERYPFTKGQLRHFIAKRRENGLATSIRKIGRRVYIREDLFDEWIENHVEADITVVSGSDDCIAYECISIDDMGLPVRAKHCLFSMGIKGINELASYTEEELLKCKSMGKKSLNEIKETLLEYGLMLKEG